MSKDFWDKHSAAEYQGTGFLSADETEALLDSGETVQITGVELQEDPFNKGRKRYLATLILRGEERQKGFGAGTVHGRDALLADVEGWLADGGAPVPVAFVRWGKATGLEAAAFDDGAPDLELPPEEEEDDGAVG